MRPCLRAWSGSAWRFKSSRDGLALAKLAQEGVDVAFTYSNSSERADENIKAARETAKLENQQRGINQQVRADRAANGGKLTAGEKAQVNREQNRASRNIYNKKHNDRTQGGVKH